MKSIEELKKEQYDLKAKLHEVVEFINGEEYFALSPREKGLIGQQRAGMEMYLNALTNRIYSKDEYSFDSTSAMMVPLIMNMFSGGCGFGSPCSSEMKDKLEDSDFTEKDEEEPKPSEA